MFGHYASFYVILSWKIEAFLYGCFHLSNSFKKWIYSNNLCNMYQVPINLEKIIEINSWFREGKGKFCHIIFFGMANSEYCSKGKICPRGLILLGGGWCQGTEHQASFRFQIASFYNTKVFFCKDYPSWLNNQEKNFTKIMTNDFANEWQIFKSGDLNNFSLSV